MTRILLVTGFPARHVKEKFSPLFTRLGLTIARVVSPSFSGPIQDVRAVVLIDQMVSRPEQDALRKRAHASRLAFVVLPKEQFKWPAILKNLAPREQVVEAEEPKPLTPSQVAPELPAPAGAAWAAATASPPSKRVSFGAWLRQSRAGVAQGAFAKLLQVDQAAVSKVEHGYPVSPGLFDKIVALLGHPPAHVTPAKLTRPRGRPPMSRLALTLPRSAPTEPKRILAPSPPLKSLLRAARAVGLQGEFAVRINDDTAVVSIGSEAWTGADPDEAIAAARRDLDSRISGMLRRLEEARAGLGGVL